MTDNVDPNVDRLGKDNPLNFFTTGLFAGSNLPSCNRLSVGAKSPLTGTIKEANAGGTVAAAMAQHGIKMIIVEDMPHADAGWKVLIY
jgi:aldehyde:ferredoxin oxidoreductase